ncbi:imidazole glycerol phosphate synthase subunit HisF [Desulfosediminicola flagellatus]|uniref:imidazole glycerol phosphate synthase subunit HisF n=1 Tax=Desulfosediminicola flagellatus TaxID=2569541 RepID=UPI0010AC6EB2|nr:imidazole glycerol phosphate synthase subunit HisF [Desulfosediminicola flagellatus]
MITLLDYGAGNVRSVRNAIRKLGFEVKDVETPEEIVTAEKLIFPGVGNFGVVMERLVRDGYAEKLIERIHLDKATFGICVALQTFFEGSAESPGVAGLGIIPGQIERFSDSELSVPQIGWNGVKIHKSNSIFDGYNGEKFYFVHSFKAVASEENKDWILTTTDYGEEFVSSVAKGQVIATQFHPEKSGDAGLRLLEQFLKGKEIVESGVKPQLDNRPTKIAKRIIACLDVRSNDAGDLVVTKGDQYDVRQEGEVRNLGKPVELARRYYNEGADEVTFLNITGFRNFPLNDQPMLEVLRETSKNVFVPLTIGGGIREFTDSDGNFYSALDVASRYFRSGADKISIGSDAVYAVEKYLEKKSKDGTSAIEQISIVYGAQAVVISVDPRRVYVNTPDETTHATIAVKTPGPNGEKYCWYQCTVSGGREGRDIDVVQLVTVCEKLGAGEILLNCIDKDGTNSGFDHELINMVRGAVKIPVIASSGAGTADHFTDVFRETNAEAALAAGIFHREEVPISKVKSTVANAGIEIR